MTAANPARPGGAHRTGNRVRRNHKRSRRPDVTIRWDRAEGEFLLTARTIRARRFWREAMPELGYVAIVGEDLAGPLADTLEAAGLKLRDEKK
jgi:hypothetical protein